MVVAGVNLGGNMGDDVTYSGTVGAALEAALRGLPAVAVSVAGQRRRGTSPRRPGCCAHRRRACSAAACRHGLVLNVNLPDRPVATVRGVRVARLGGASCHERIVLETGDGAVAPSTRILCERARLRERAGTDFEVVAAGYVAVTPLHFDLVDPRAFELLEGWRLGEAVWRCSTPTARRSLAPGRDGASDDPDCGAPA